MSCLKIVPEPYLNQDALEKLIFQTGGRNHRLTVKPNRLAGLKGYSSPLPPEGRGTNQAGKVGGAGLGTQPKARSFLR